MDTITVILPIYKGESTIQKTLESLFVQSRKFNELIIVNDASPDDSKKIAEICLRGKIKYRMIDHKKNMGLAKSYNDAVADSIGNLIITLHQDVILERNALRKLIEPFEDKNVVAAGHCSFFPWPVWKKFNFWQKCFFARFAGKEIFGINGQFDCFRKDALWKAGLFDATRFRTAGEDADIVCKLSRLGEIARTNARLIHLQDISPNFSPKDIIRKQKQHSEARGALLALGRIRGFTNVTKTFFREILFLTLLIPYVNIVSSILILCYCFFYTKPVYFEEYKNPRIIILPFFNIYLLFVGFIYSLKGFVIKRQVI